MFYSQDILQKRGGKFGIIWIAATQPKKLTRRDYARVNVKKTSEAILNCIQIPPTKRGSFETRLSLYLSSQLMFGVVRCLNKQVDFLLGDLRGFLGQIRSTTAHSSTADIDLKVMPRAEQVTLMDMAAASDIRGPFCDPFFGKFDREDMMKQLAILDEWRMQMSVEPSGSPSMTHPTTPRMKKDIKEKPFKPVVGDPHTVSDPKDIKLKEISDQVDSIEIPGEKELPGLFGEDLDLADDSPEADTMVEELLSPRTMPIITEIESLTPEEKTPAVRPVQRRAPPSPGVTPAPPTKARTIKRPNFTMELTPVTPSPIRRKRRRQHLLVDRETQIPKKRMRELLLTGSDTCIPLIRPDPHPSTVDELFNYPGRKTLRHPKLFPLWKRNAEIGDTSETESEKNTPIWTVPELGTHKSVRDTELLSSPRSEEELPKQALERPFETTWASEISDIEIKTGLPYTSLEEMRQGGETPISMERTISMSHEKSLGDQSLDKTEETLQAQRLGREMSIPEDEMYAEAQTRESTSVRDLGSLFVVPEEKEDVVSPLVSPALEIPHHVSSIEVLSCINSQLKSKEETTFRDICPTSKTRPYAAQMFSEFLQLCKTGQVSARQEEPYGDIYITRGAN